MAEIKQKAPQYLDLLLALGATDRSSAGNEDFNFREIKAVTSVCTILNARSSHCNGFQLLMGIMLIARYTGMSVNKDKITR